jgi:dihydroorotate dehydrogenase
VSLYTLLRRLIFALDAETAHRLTINLLKLRTGTAFTPEPQWTPPLRTNVAGLDFPNPVGLAAGFDKNGEVADQMLTLGFGFVEVGTVTPRPQRGNERPRLFRLTEDRAVINRMGFNNRGQQAALKRLKRGTRRAVQLANPGILGVNIGANKDSSDRIGDYVEGVKAMSGVADYLTVNISSPNTPGLRALQDQGALDALLDAIKGARSADGPPKSALEAGPQPASPPIFLKVAPDLQKSDPERIVRAALDHGIDAIIVSNTTISRPPLKSARAREQGGLSGEPLKSLALDALRQFRSASGGAIPLIGCGGIATADDAWERIRAGASLIQLYSAMVYEGPGIARKIVEGLATKVKQAGFASIAEAVGTEL